MKYCTHCGKELLDEAVVCVGCGCATGTPVAGPDVSVLVNTLSQRVKTNGIIWLVIGILQVICGFFLNWVFLIVGALNIISSVQDMNYSKTVLDAPSGIVAKFEPIVGPIITLIYNLVIGGVIGVVGSIYYFVAIRSYVLENRVAFDSLNESAA